ncbi:MAG: DUF2868 domain-containing protein [Opitutaceae bacterium]
MSAAQASRPSLADVATASAILDRDEERPADEVAQRDRRIGLHMPLAASRLEATLGWVEAVCREDAALRRLHQQVDQGMAWCGTIITGLGLFLGWSAAFGVFFFDGSGRVNTIGILGVLVLLPALFLLPFLVAALPASVTTRIPGGAAAAALSRGLSPGRLAAGIVRFLPTGFRQTWEQVSGRAHRQQTLFSAIHKWTLLRWSQLFALGFQVAALSAALSLILFTDLAFGWSTTLTSGDPVADAATVHRLTSTLATPWAWAFESADPSIGLILDSRYFRAAEAVLNPEEAARLGAWWPFMVLTLLVYGLLPRVFTYTIARARLSTACRLTLTSLPGLSPVIHRMHQAHVQTTSDDPETGRSGLSSPAPTLSTANRPETFGALINWSAVPVDARMLERAFGPIAVHAAGGSSPTAQDRRLGAILADQLGHATGLGLLVKAWEPPLMEWVDFLKDLRAALPARTPIVVLPIGVDSETRLTGGTPEQLAIWMAKIRAVGDPWLSLGTVPEVTVS